MSAYEIPDEAPRKKCAACGATIAMVMNRATMHLVPVAVATSRSHFEDCTDPERFSRHRQRLGFTSKPESTTRQERLL